MVAHINSMIALIVKKHVRKGGRGYVMNQVTLCRTAIRNLEPGEYVMLYGNKIQVAYLRSTFKFDVVKEL